MAEDDVIHIHDFPNEIRFSKSCSAVMNVPRPEDRTLSGTEKETVRNALIKCNGSQIKPPMSLGMTRDQMRHRIEEYGIVIPSKFAR